ncbi:MAG: phage tail tape measure protein [Phycisphaerae bacterium]|nr:phage tail tape measure protein [Phycisphaerae bacterium]
MARTQGIRAGRAYVELFADDSRLIRGLRQASKRLQAFGAQIRALGLKFVGLGAAILAPMAGAAKAFSSMGDQVAKMAKRTGLSVETLSELRFVASQTGTEFESLEMGFRRMQRSIYDAGRGMSTTVDALADLGLTFKDLDGLSPEEQFKMLGEAIGRVDDHTKKAAIAMTLFGRTGTNLLPMFAQGARGIEELQQQARDLGLTMSAEDAQAAEDFTDALDRLWKVVKMGVFRVGAALAPALETFVDRVTDIVVKTGAWIDRNRQLVVTVAKVAAGILAGGVAMVVLGTIISGLGCILGGLMTALTTVNSVFTGVQAVLAALVSPIGLAVGAVAGLTAALLVLSGAGRQTLDWLGEKLRSLVTTTAETFQAIGAALAQGDISAAAGVLWAALQLAWAKGTASLLGLWHTALFAIISTWESAVHGVTIAWIETIAALRQGWAGFVAWHQRTSESLANVLAKTWMRFRKNVLGDESIDLNFTDTYLDNASADAKAQIDARRDQALLAAEQQRRRQRAAAGQMHQFDTNQREQRYQQQMAALEQQLADARANWRSAVQDVQTNNSGAGGERPGGGLSDIADKVREAMAAVDTTLARQSVQVTGTFGGFAVGGLGSGSAMDRTAAASEETARNTRRLVDEAKVGGARFS